MKSHIFIILLILLFSCGQEMGETSPEISSLPQVRFAMEHIKSSSSVVFLIDSTLLGEQEYSIKPGRKKTAILGGDADGLMYGGLEVAEQLRLYGEVKETRGVPSIKRRGIKFNIPLDARTPSYDDSGDAAQENIAEMWSWDFWESFLDQMALNRYNVLSLWNPHPFPSMIKLADYPDVALEDVYRTTLEPVGRENEWGDPGLVTRNVVSNLEKVVSISMEEKISFWRKVMKHAKERGIHVYWINWNICPNSVAPPVEPYYKTYEINLGQFEKGKHGITYEISNPITIDYYRKAVKQFLLTYPDVSGIGVTAGEHMPLTWNGYNREQWLWETYGLGILDAKKEQPGREVGFIHRVWHSDMDQIMKYWKDYPDPFDVSFKYAKARLYSSPELPFAESHLEEMTAYGLDSWWNLRNDDIFVYRWGDPEYVRSFLDKLPDKHTAGYYMGSDGYVWGREFISKDPGLSGELEIQKHWFRFMLWGRLGYDNKLEEDFFVRQLEVHFGLDDGDQLYETWKAASGIIPLVNQFHWRDWDHHWSVESCQARPVLGGFRDVFDFMENPTLENSHFVNPMDFAVKTDQGVQVKGISPLAVADSLELLATNVFRGTEGLQKISQLPEFRALLDDILAQAWLGLYYSKKISAAVSLARHRTNGDPKALKHAQDELMLSLDHWKEYASISTRNYQIQMLARTNMMDWNAIADSISFEIDRVNKIIP